MVDMHITEAIELKARVNSLFKTIKALSARIQKREGNLCQYEGAKLEIKKGEIMKLRKLKTEKTQTLKQLNDRIPTMWDAWKDKSWPLKKLF